ncbi:hypothetical protein BH23GEM8_BH23GEM8_04680 [soil metagenome]
MRPGTPDAFFQFDPADSFLRLHIEVGEIVIAAVEPQGATLGRGSASRGAHLLSTFLTTLGSGAMVSRTMFRKGLRRSIAGLAEGDGTRGQTRAVTVRSTNRAA